ncbi:MAG TPA: cupin domain-containing protein [Chloroflexi bacterium]|nr:cupin domain-containing protein [Chloroflexota bacterium]
MPTARTPIINLAELELRAGPLWASEGEDLDANLLYFTPETPIAAHVNHEVDVGGVVLQGAADLTIDDQHLRVAPGSIFYIPKGARRSLTPLDPFVYVYVSCHKRRRGLWPEENSHPAPRP